MRRAWALRKLGRRDQQLGELRTVAADGTQPNEVMRRAFVALTEDAQQDYATLLDLAGRWLAALPEDDDALWARAFALARLARHDEAAVLLGAHNADPNTVWRAKLAAEIAQRTRPPLDAIREIAALSDRYQRSDPHLEGFVIATAARTQHEADPELKERIAETFATYDVRFPGQKLIQSISAQNPVQFMEQMRDQLRRGEAHRREVERSVISGESPIALLAASAGRRIAEVISAFTALPLGYGAPDLEPAKSKLPVGR